MMPLLPNTVYLCTCVCERTVTPVAQVGPDDVLLGEAEDAQSSSPHAAVDDDSGVGHQVGSLKQLHPGTPGGAVLRTKRSSHV